MTTWLGRALVWGYIKGAHDASTTRPRQNAHDFLNPNQAGGIDVDAEGQSSQQ